MVMMTTLPPPGEGIKHEQTNTRVIFNNKDIGNGTLFIAESRLSWIENATGRGFSVQYPHVSIHAVCRDPLSFPEECLYLILDHYLKDPSDTANGDCNGKVKQEEDDDDDEEESDNECEEGTELRFVPEDKTSLTSMYDAMAHCQALHPHINDSLSEDSSVEEEEDDEDEVDGPRASGSNAEMEMEVEGQFDDA